MTRTIIGLVIILIGLSILTGFSFVKFIIALVIIAIGIKMIFGKKSSWDWQEKVTSHEDFLNEVAIFSPLNKVVESDDFQGGKIVLIFAGGEIDLSKVKTTAKEIEMEITAIFGGGKLIIPKHWKLNSKGTAIFGGYDSHLAKSEGDITFNLKGAAIFGGIEILN